MTLVTYMMYQISIAAITNYQKLTGLNQHKFILLQFWRSEVQNGCHGTQIKVLAGLFSFWRQAVE